MNFKKIKSAASILLMLSAFCVFINSAYAVNPFRISKIRVLGAQRIEKKTILSYLPVASGDEFTDVVGQNILRTLYSTQFFDDVFITRQNNILVIHVNERPTIASIELKGNKKISKKQLNEVLRNAGLYEGRVYNSEALEHIKIDLLKQYNSVGRYNAEVEVHVKELPRNRVSIVIHITEGGVARIRAIYFTGNRDFSSHELISHMLIAPHNIISYFQSTDQYTEPKMNASIHALEEFYLSHGYVRFKINSVQTSLSTNKHDIYVTVNVSEGAKYHFSGYDVSGKLILPRAEFNNLILIKHGDVFSKETLNLSMEHISDALGNKGYGMPRINLKPEIDDQLKTVFVHFVIDAGNRIYVHRINFDGNVKTADYVLRRAMHQREGAVLITRDIKESERRLKNLGYLKNIQMKTVPVVGKNNQVDLNYHVDEDHSAEAMASLSYSQEYKLHFSANYNQHNFRGTGNTLGVGFTSTRYGENYNLSYYNPYYTPSGIGHGYSLYYQHHSTKKSDIASYDMNRLGLSTNYNIPLTDYSAAQIAFGYQNMKLKIGTSPPIQYINFVQLNGTVFDEFVISGGVHYNDFDQFPFPTDGVNSQFSWMVALPLQSGSLRYYKLSYAFKYFHPIALGFIGTLSAHAAYANSWSKGHTEWPFFENYYGGGLNDYAQLRGYLSHTVGPRDIFGRAIGGNVALSGSAGLVLPYPISQHAFRTTLFLDAANVYQDDLPDAYLGGGSGPLRYSFGISVHWQSPFGPLVFSLATPIHKQRSSDPTKTDRTKSFQFSISSGL